MLGLGHFNNHKQNQKNLEINRESRFKNAWVKVPLNINKSERLKRKLGSEYKNVNQLPVKAWKIILVFVLLAALIMYLSEGLFEQLFTP